MIGFSRALLLVVLAVLLQSVAAAQTVARTFAELHTIIRPGDYVIVVDRADAETWGQVIAVSERTLTVAPAQRFASRVEVGKDRRDFAVDAVSLVLRSDMTGARGAGVYPPSWERVEALPPGSEVTIVLASGERQRSRLADVSADGLRVRTPSGQSARFDKSDILRIERHDVNDPVSNGIAIGVLAGAGAGFAIASAMYAACGDGCDAPARGPTYASAIGFSAGIGAAVGWIVDRAHRGKEVVFPAVAPIITRDRKALTFTVRF